MKIKIIFLINSCLFISLPNIALAYIGPGMGMGAIIGIIAVLGVLLLTIVAIIYYPIKIFVKKLIDKNKEKKDQ
jgi:hypothetical protein|tara:strand:- start:436 stop:657 length:222 start_codon:yes stop_codon:yes gene_type:complete